MVDHAPQTDQEQTTAWEAAVNFFEGITPKRLEALNKLRSLGWVPELSIEGTRLALIEAQEPRFPREIDFFKETAENGTQFVARVKWADLQTHLNLSYEKEHLHKWLKDAVFFLDPDNGIALKIVGNVRDRDYSYIRTISIPFENSAIENHERLEVRG